MPNTIVVLEGDQTGQELLEEALRVLDPSVIGMELSFQRFDLSLEKRRATQNAVVHEAAEAMLVFCCRIPVAVQGRECDRRPVVSSGAERPPSTL